MNPKSLFVPCESLGTSYFESLLVRIRTGEATAKEELIRDAYARALRLTRLILRGKEPGKPNGLTHHVCSLAYEKFAAKLTQGLISDFENLTQMLSYLSKVIQTTAIDEARKSVQKKERIQFPSLEFVDDHHLPRDVESIDVERRIQVQEMIDSLEEMDRTIIVLVFYYDYNDSEVAQLTGLRRQGMKSRIDSILLKLRRMCDRQD